MAKANFTSALRYRNYAEELRVMAADRMSAKDRDSLLGVAAHFDHMAASLEVAADAESVRKSRPHLDSL